MYLAPSDARIVLTPRSAPVEASPTEAPPSHKKKKGTKDHIPRPANAFMLYRSHLIKSGQIPKLVEQRQQNISRVAGECWNLLNDEEKAVWHNEAKKAMEQHRIRHPDYKFILLISTNP